MIIVYIYFSFVWYVWINRCLLLEERESNKSGGDLTRYSTYEQSISKYIFNQTTPTTGGRSLGVLPVTASLVASMMSALTMIGFPAEVYTQGTMILVIVLITPIIALITGWVYLPTFHNLQLLSSFQYLEMRFSNTVKVLCGAVFSLSMMLYIATMVYAPALALEQVMGLNVDISCASIFIICVFYTSMGGIKAVVWTDVFQLFFMFISVIILLVLATTKAGGVMEVFDTNYQDGRIQIFTSHPDPRERHTFWGMIFGNSFIWLSIFGVSQTQVQRFVFGLICSTH